MKLNFRALDRLLILLAVLCPASIALRLFTYWSELDGKSGFFRSAGNACTLFNAVGFFVFFLCLSLTLSRKGTPVDGGSAPVRQEDSLLMHNDLAPAEEHVSEFSLRGFSKEVSVWHGAFTAFASLLPGFGFLSYALSFFADKTMRSDPYHMAFAALSILSGLFFLVLAFRNSNLRSRPMAFFALVPAFWCTFRMVIEYRDLTRFLNKSLYIGQFLFIISVLVFFLYQAQLLLGEGSLAQPNAYVFSAAAAFFFGLTARLPHLIAVIGDRISMDLVDTSSLLMDLAITLFIGTKLFSTTKRS